MANGERAGVRGFRKPITRVLSKSKWQRRSGGDEEGEKAGGHPGGHRPRDSRPSEMDAIIGLGEHGRCRLLIVDFKVPQTPSASTTSTHRLCSAVMAPLVGEFRVDIPVARAARYGVGGSRIR
ncbi:uncharacterized protein LY79DRAFT_279597 [Colletotrichum navitas]|uniref:Uncharacterized protein n=1 Tax=Colletotrichum navitas TaxID=681940 RepID=A0AAD8PUJ4_9PEZI|nr:uncharacterized protein LY79DRAFT_279597 [Colletotrichum navitas]KAK1584929.1 hypothetical protein LY79DRAFT_279597 [Colletotrichum navitas]